MRRIIRAWLREKRRRVELEARVAVLEQQNETLKRWRVDAVASLGSEMLVDELPAVSCDVGRVGHERRRAERRQQS